MYCRRWTNRRLVRFSKTRPRSRGLKNCASTWRRADKQQLYASAGQQPLTRGSLSWVLQIRQRWILYSTMWKLRTVPSETSWNKPTSYSKAPCLPLSFRVGTAQWRSCDPNAGLSRVVLYHRLMLLPYRGRFDISCTVIDAAHLVNHTISCISWYKKLLFRIYVCTDVVRLTSSRRFASSVAVYWLVPLEYRTDSGFEMPAYIYMFMVCHHLSMRKTSHDIANWNYTRAIDIILSLR